MKLIISHLRKAFMLSLLTIAFAGESFVTRANGHEPIGNHSGSASTAEVKYIGNKEEGFVFNVVYNNTTGSRFSLRVLDADGNQLFQRVYTDKKFNKKFKIADTESYTRLTFVIRNYQDNSTQTFQVDSNTRLVEDIEVKEVK